MDFRIDVRLPRHWKYRKLKLILGISPMEHLITFWATVCEQVPNGELKGWSKKDVDLSSEWSETENSFCAAMIESGFLDVTKYGFYPHDWAEHQPWVVGSKERIEIAKKAGKASANARREKTRKNKTSTGDQHDVQNGCNGISTDYQPHNASLTPSPSPSPLTTPSQDKETITGGRTMVDSNGDEFNIDTGEIIHRSSGMDPAEKCPF